jgi:hypothetical protein
MSFHPAPRVLAKRRAEDVEAEDFERDWDADATILEMMSTLSEQAYRLRQRAGWILEHLTALRDTRHGKADDTGDPDAPAPLLPRLRHYLNECESMLDHSVDLLGDYPADE